MIKGQVWKFGDNIDTDVLSPNSSKSIADPVLRAQHCLAAINPEFPKRIRPGDIVVGGKNFGCGSSRESAAKNLKVLGVSCVIAPSFGRIFLRNSINLGLPLLECAEVPLVIEEGDVVEVELTTGRIFSLTRGKEVQARPFPPFLLSIIEQGGLLNYAKARLETRKVAIRRGDVAPLEA